MLQNPYDVGAEADAQDWHTYRFRAWQSFCDRYGVVADSVPLFATVSGREVATIAIGTSRLRRVLQRSAAMERLVITEARKVIDDYAAQRHTYDGLIYMMFRESDTGAVPLYIGKTEKYGKNNGNLSDNIKNIEVNRDKFCRWGSNYAYHIGDLSAVTLGHTDVIGQDKYRRWAAALFEFVPTDQPRLKFDVFFWVRAWRSQDSGPWDSFGPTNLTFLEYQLIGLASALFPHDVLNDEGVNRARPITRRSGAE